MATEVYLHIGPPKTGTTYLQALLWANRAALRSQGVLVPGRAPVSQFHAVVDLLGRDPTGLSTERTAGAWAKLVEQTRRWPGRVVVSHENFGFAGEEKVRQVREELGDANLHIVYTARSLTAAAPAAWQERLKNRSDLAWHDFLAEVGDGSDSHPFWRLHGGPALFGWAERLPAKRVHVITVPVGGARPELLWERFAGVIGVDPSTCSTDLPRSNESLGIDEAAFLRQYNAGPARDLTWDAYRTGVKHGLAPVLARRGDKRRIQVSESQAEVFSSRAQLLAERINAAGLDVVGDLDELVDPPGTSAMQDDDASDAERLHAAADAAVDGLVRELVVVQQRRREDARAHREELRLLRQQVRDAEAHSRLPLWRLAVRRAADRSTTVDRLCQRLLRRAPRR